MRVLGITLAETLSINSQNFIKLQQPSSRSTSAPWRPAQSEQGCSKHCGAANPLHAPSASAPLAHTQPPPPTAALPPPLHLANSPASPTPIPRIDPHPSPPLKKKSTTQRRNSGPTALSPPHHPTSLPCLALPMTCSSSKICSDDTRRFPCSRQASSPVSHGSRTSNTQCRTQNRSARRRTRSC